ncbi:MAG TPA: hypothetical protein VLB67_06395 [Acidimicrobiia bacterium]|nr:hypothetical protein [Acidimicrobiia bacterium]
MSDITHIGRTIDPRLASNRVALLLPMGAGLLLFGLGDLRRAMAGGLATFAAWAIARELDPDRPRSATLAATLAVCAALAVGTPAPAPLFIALVTLRILVRTTGLPPKATDLAVVSAAAVAAADTPWGWAAGILLAFAIVRDAALPGDPPAAAAIWGAVTAVGVTVRVALSDELGLWEYPDLTALVVLVTGIVGAAIVVRPVPVLSLGDYTLVPLEPRRLREGAVFGILTAVVVVLVAGHAGVVAVAPLLLAFAAVAVGRVLDDG